MKTNVKRYCIYITLCICSSFFLTQIVAQTPDDVIMMNKKQWCNGLTYSYGQWKDYWEGTNKRDNQNLGTVSSQPVMFMSNYGITNKLNVMVGLPYVSTKASAGTLQGMKGIQDFSLAVKWKAISVPFAKGKFNLFGVGEFVTPASNYVIDFLPLSIGLGSTSFSAKLMTNYEKGYLNIRLSGAYVWRSNITLDRTAYYTTNITYSNEVDMPNVTNFNFAIGVHKKYLIADAVLYNMTTLGGFDIRKNDMPFPSNKMNSTSTGVTIKYTLPSNIHISFISAVNYVIAGRNVGQAASFSVGCFYANSFVHKVKKTTEGSTKN